MGYEADALPIYGDDCTQIAIIESMEKLHRHLRDFDSISVSVSGGSDSDCIVHMICKYFPEYLPKIHFVFCDTGIEYQATRKHIAELQKEYGIKIDTVRGIPIPIAVKRYGVPMLSKLKSTRIEGYCKGLPWAQRYIFPDDELRAKMRNDIIFSAGQIELAEYCKANGVKVSAKCCEYSKKRPIIAYQREKCVDLVITGERKAEGGQRSINHTCFEFDKRHKVHKFKPLFYWDDETKRAFKAAEGFKNSACYEVYGMTRTGCAGCPFALDISENLQAMFEHEPKLFNACMRVFGLAYELTDKFGCRKRRQALPDSWQIPLDVYRA